MKLIVFLYLVSATKAFQPAHFVLSSIGNEFQAAHSVELLKTWFNISTIIRCTMLCYTNTQCRTFDYDSNSQQCRLYEGSVDTGSLLSTQSSTLVGWINLDGPLYNLYNASNDKCVDNRFLTSDPFSGFCECPIHTFWNGSICVNQKYVGAVCVNDDWCRTDLNISCQSSMCVVSGSISSISSTVTSTVMVSTPVILSSVQSTPTESTTTVSTAMMSSSVESTAMASTATMSTATMSTVTISTATSPLTTMTTSIVTTPCTPQSSSGGILFSVINPTSSIYPNYTCYAYTWIATGSSVTLSFFFRHDPGGWMLDDVSVYHNTTQMIVNGGFETGDLTGWTRSGTCNLNVGQAYSGSTYAKSGNWYYYDLCAGNNNGDTLSQTFSTIAGDTYLISFWLTNYDCCGVTEIANITII